MKPIRSGSSWTQWIRKNALSSELSEIHGARFQCNSHVMYHIKSQSHPLSTSFIKSNYKRLQLTAPSYEKQANKGGNKYIFNRSVRSPVLWVKKDISWNNSYLKDWNRSPPHPTTGSNPHLKGWMKWKCETKTTKCWNFYQKSSTLLNSFDLCCTSTLVSFSTVIFARSARCKEGEPGLQVIAISGPFCFWKGYVGV